MKLSREFMRDGESVSVQVERVEGDLFRVRVGDNVYEYDARALPDGGVQLRQRGDGGKVGVARGAGNQQSYMVRVDGRTHALEAPQRRGGAGGAGGDGTVRAPMTGTVLEVSCAPGDAVDAEQTLVVVSAMKMEHKLSAGVAGVVQSVTTEPGATVDQGAALIVVEPSED